MQNKPKLNKSKTNKAKKANFKKRQLKKPTMDSEQRVSNLPQRLDYQNHSYQLMRYPATDDQSLRAWSNAEILAIDYLHAQNLLTDVGQIHLYNDRFGVWCNLLAQQTTTCIITHASQHKAIAKNLELNSLATEINVASPLSALTSVELALIKVPKSVELFELFLQQIHKASKENTQVICGFMTKYFASSMIKVAGKYFDQVEQSQAWKKARLLILKQPKSAVSYSTTINDIEFNDKTYQQYFGVFSADKVDIGTQFLLKQYQEEKLMIKAKELKILDLACGNGVIARELSAYNPSAEFTLIDDFALAVESAKMNLAGINARFICDDNLISTLTDGEFDLVVSNPPFHFEHENNIEVALSLFADVKRVLKSGGRFVLVANKHLNYSTHLSEMFNKVFLVASNQKFEVYECLK